MRISICKSYEELPLFLNAKMFAQILDVSESSNYKLMHDENFPSLRMGNRIVVHKEKFKEWVEQDIQCGA